MNITVLENQSLLDISVQTSGDIYAAIELAIANDKSITDSFDAGAELIPAEIYNTEIVNYYNNRRLTPATAITQEEMLEGGIDFMGIEIDFIVS